MQDNDEPLETSSSSSHRTQLPPLAPRHQPAGRDRLSRAGPRPARLTHRSRAGCWTCRARKVKCDEQHPRCGPCTRLNRECDWDLRWNFSDSTAATQTKYTNVRTSGSTAWDPRARQSLSGSPILRQHDDLPAFRVLTTEEDRERKAETQRPGTFGVVLTPESFADLPEYAARTSSSSRRESVQSRASSLQARTPPLGRLLTRTRTDPNVVFVDRFEEFPHLSLDPFSMLGGRRTSLPEGLQYLSITPPSSANNVFSTAPQSLPAKEGDHLIAHFRHYISRRLVQPQMEATSGHIVSPGSTRDTFEIESTKFQPLYHAICAISALNLHYSGHSSLEEAMQHYHQAISAQSTTSNPDDLLSSGVFLRHFLLFIYDICMSNDSSGADMWTINLNHLQRIATLRHERFGQEPHAYLLWCICELDMYACLLGSGNCDFVSTVLRLNMLPSLDQQIPLIMPSLSGPFLAGEASTFPQILSLRQGVVIQTAKLAQMAQQFRHEASQSSSPTPGSAARWQASVTQLQNELMTFWRQAYPHYLDPENPRAGENLSNRVRIVFEHAFTLYQAGVIYSRTSMFPGQRRIPVAQQNDIYTDTENRVRSIITVATIQLEEGNVDRRQIIFPLFIAGFATSLPDVKIQALDIMKSYEMAGIGQNTYRTRQLLTAVYEEQRRRSNEGGRMEDVDWLAIAKQRSLTVVNCGL